MYISKDPRRYEKIKCINCGKLTSKYFKSDFRKIRKFCDNPCYWQWKTKQIAQNTHNWKGSNANHAAKHHWVRKHFGKAHKCENKDCSGLSKSYEWSNKDHKYMRERADWQMLCQSCHNDYDYLKFGTRKHFYERINQ